jgi:hypothetical protein
MQESLSFRITLLGIVACNEVLTTLATIPNPGDRPGWYILDYQMLVFRLFI